MLGLIIFLGLLATTATIQYWPYVRLWIRNLWIGAIFLFILLRSRHLGG